MKHKTNSNKNSETEKDKKASDSKDKNSESDEEIFTQEDFEDALRRVSRKISEPDKKKT